MNPAITIAPAAARDAAVIGALLRDAGLPHGDFAPHLAHILVARHAADGVVGAIGAEVYGPEALLRSFVVAPKSRGAGLGSRLFAALERSGGDWGVERWWLLTTTAEGFFSARGFRATSRTDAPPVIAATGEFSGLCPSIASCWSRERRAP